ncbi:hypothetical protein, unknown function [Leishmania mexicana MHOM/GT/2001/U1103]|uniref:Uncharacterized protein n=1 Tax=Leishmania mexicana (strain MHOM/GT/2001/U1103) TaxID=929439 RepID=E9AZG9_LEIMU|nr:hypothetical protein, unknown function [Leishmania mexicana MHOM/GT/2001/U1103]CBZ28369.1 hypothetical protein, unknown function [Leishmania mexicana MHOM/GT/2001/U1103]
MSQLPLSPAGSSPFPGSVNSFSSIPSFHPEPQLVGAVCHANAAEVRRLLAPSAPGLCVWCDADQNSLLHRAAALASPDCLIELLQSEVRFVFSQNLQGETPLHVAARCARTIVSILLLVAKYGAVCVLDRNGDTFLHGLLSNERISHRQLLLLIESLLDRADVTDQINVVNNRGVTLYDVAHRWHPDSAALLELLLRRGAVSGALVLHDEVVSLVIAEEEEREKVREHERSSFALLRHGEGAECARIHRQYYERRKLFGKERRRRHVCYEKEASTWTSLVETEKISARRIGGERAARECCAAEVQRIGRGFLARSAVYRLFLRRNKVRLLAEKNAGTTASAALHMASEAKVKENISPAAESNEALSVLVVPPAAQEVPLRRFPEALLVHLQSIVRTRRARRHYLHVRRMTIIVQRVWRRHQARITRRRQQAADVLLSAVQRYQLSKERGTLMEKLMLMRIKVMLREVTRLLTGLVWRENFCSVFREIVFMQRRRLPPPPMRLSRFRRLQLLAARFERFILLAQFTVSLFLLIYMGYAPRTSASQVHNKVDMAFLCVEFVLICCLPLCWWRLWDVAVVVTALICTAASCYGGSIVITLFTLKLPFVVRQLVPRHPGTCTYCRTIEYSVVYLLMFVPFAVAGIGSTVRSTTVNHLLLSNGGNWGRVFLSLLSTVSPQHTVLLLIRQTNTSVDIDSLLPLRAQQTRYVLPDGDVLLRLQIPLVQLIVFRGVMCLYWWSAVIVGTHNAIRHHYDISDETKLKLNKHRFRNEGKEKLFDAHRAATIEALGQQLDGVMWEDDVRAAKEAIEASHYDHNTNITVHRFVRRVQDTLESHGGAILSAQALQRSVPVAKATRKDASRWDCRNEDPHSRGTYDIGVVETALGMIERKGLGERFIERQWTGALLRKEMNWVLIGMLIMASVKPNLFAMEAAFSAVFAVELAASLYFLRLEFIFSHYVRLMIRVFCVVIGFVPPGIPFVAFRSVRLVEGWSLLFSVPGMVRWGMVYLVASFFTIWMISYVAALQFLAAAELQMRPSICSSKRECLVVSLRELVLPAFTPEHIDPLSEAPVMAMLVFFTHFCFAPFLLAIMLHPLLRLSNFIGRFLRLVVQSLHKDVLDYVENYLEGGSWYTHWGLKANISVEVIVRMKIWLNDVRRRRFSPVWGSSYSSVTISNQHMLQKTPMKRCEPELEEECKALTEIICRGEFASLEENSAHDRLSGNPVAQFLSRVVVRNVYVHYLNVALTFVSIAFLWVADASLDRDSVLMVSSCVVHLLSVAASIVVIPHDSTAIMTLVSACALLCAVVLVLVPDRRLRSYYCVRFLSLLRIGQLQVFPFREMKRVVKMYIDSAIKILFPVAVMGGAAYMAELLRAQVFMVRFKPLAWMNINWSNPAEVEALRSNVSYPDFLAAVPRSRTSWPNVGETSALFVAYFSEDAYVFYSIYCFWVLPGICISTCLSYLFWVGTNLRDTNRLMVDMIPLLEDPITMSGFSWYQWLYRYVGNVILLASLVFGCIFSPTTSATSDDLIFFLGFEVAFTLCGLAEAIMSCSFAVHRCARSIVSWRTCQDDGKHTYVLFGDCVFLLCEVIQLLYYCVAVVLCSMLLVEGSGCLISPDEYATFFLTVRFVFLLRLLSRELLLSLMRHFFSISSRAAGIVVYFVACASALADVYAAETRTRYTPATWCAAFDAILRLAFTSAIPANFEGYWQPFNGTAVASAMKNSSTTLYVIEEYYTTSRLAFVLAVIGKAIMASIVGLFVGSLTTTVRTVFLHVLPAKSLLLYRTLCGGLTELVRFGMQNHDDMRPQTRRRIQSRKFRRMFMPEGIPSWSVPHLLEELGICRPVRQRRFMYVLMRLLEYMPTSEKRQERVLEYMHVWDTYRCGGPAHLLFSELPIYPPAAAPQRRPNPYYPSCSLATMRRDRHIAPLRLVQALAIFELGFPADSSVGSKLWMDFFSVVQKMRGATLLQSLWRMYREEKAFDMDSTRTSYERTLIAHLRRGFRKQKLRSNIHFLSFTSFQKAMHHEREVFNPSTGHFDLLNRLRGHFSGLSASPDFWKTTRDAESKLAA